MGRGAILTYHSLDETGSVISIRPEVFRRQMGALAANSIQVLPLQQIRHYLGAVVITFDDGFSNFTDHAIPTGLAEAMEQVLSNPEFATGLSQKSLARAAEFSWGNAAATLLDIFEKTGGSQGR